MSASFRHMATVAASTKRAAASGSKFGAPLVHLAEIRCTPLDPVDAELRERLGLGSAHELLQTIVDGSPDIKEGDVLVVGTREYPIRSCAEWAMRGSHFAHLVVEDLKR